MTYGGLDLDDLLALSLLGRRLPQALLGVDLVHGVLHLVVHADVHHQRLCVGACALVRSSEPLNFKLTTNPLSMIHAWPQFLTFTIW